MASDGLNIRQQPNKFSDIIGTLPFGTLIEGKIEGDWFNYERGNLHIDYLLENKDTSLIDFADEIGVDWRLLQAILKSESPEGSFRDGRLIIRFEAHIFANKVQTSNIIFDWNPNLPWKNQRAFINNEWIDIHITGPQSQNREYYVFEFAKVLHEENAHLSISMGEAQIMGFNHKSVGFNSAREMYEFASQSKENDRQLYYRYIKTRMDLIQAMRNKHFRTIAAIYNGSNVDVYSEHIKSRYVMMGGEL